MNGKILEIDSDTARRFLLPRHYSGRVPNITRAFGWYTGKPYSEDELMSVCTFGKPATNSLCIGVCGEKYSDSVYELNRLCRLENWDEPLSQFVSACLRRLRTENWIIISYSDTAMNHHGYIYQACNFLYTGVTKSRTDQFAPNNAHSRHPDKAYEGRYRTVRSAKHRYVYFCTFNKHLKKSWQESLMYPVLPYPKGDNNPDYKLGDFLEPTVIDVVTGCPCKPIVDNEQISLF